jgi:lysine-specific demethylase/histidyl-hydroxylase NO66
MGHFLELLLPQAIGAAFTNSLSLRKALPENYLSYMGVMHSDLEDHPERQAFEESVKKALRAVMGEAMDMIDAGADQMAKNYLIDRLPPAVSLYLCNCTLIGYLNE